MSQLWKSSSAPTSSWLALSIAYESGVADLLTFDMCRYISVRTYVEAQGMVTPPKSDVPQGTLDLLILNVVALGPLHGYAIAQRLRQVSRDVVDVTQGTLYPALHRLENRGFLAAEWKLSDTGRDAKFYKLTPKGRAHMASEADSWRRLAQAISAILKTSERAR